MDEPSERRIGASRIRRRWLVVSVACYGALLACLAAAIGRWADLIEWGPQLSSAEILVATIVGVVIGIALLALMVWTKCRWSGVFIAGLMILLIAIASGMLWFVLRFAASWGP